MTSPGLSQKASQKSFAPFLVVAVLALLVAIGAMPRYIGDWPWANPPTVPNKSALVAIKEQGLPIPGWQMQEQATTKLGGQTWSVEQLFAEPETISQMASGSPDNVFLLLRSQVWYADQPEVEWLDIKGSQKWKTDTHQKLSISVPQENATFPEGESSSGRRQRSNRPIRVTADYFRAWNSDRAYAVLQWYAWPTGGSPSPARWFWIDQISQWQRNQRMPWVAVSLWLPIEPFSDISVHQAMATSLGKTIQTALLNTAFLETAPP